jgi:hypothetical protein
LKPVTCICVLSVVCLVLFATGCTHSTRFSISFDQASGLKQQDPVICRDAPAGTVTRITYTPEARFLVQVELPEEFSYCATEHSRFYIGEDPARSGAKAVLIEQDRAGGQKLARDAVVQGSQRPDPGFGFAQSLEGFQKALEQTLTDLITGIENIPRSREYQELMKSMAEMESRLKTAGQAMGDTLRKEVMPQLTDQIRELTRKLRQMGQEDEARSLEKELGRLQEL